MKDFHDADLVTKLIVVIVVVTALGLLLLQR